MSAVLLRILAVFSLALGLIGLFVPGLPTTVFILVAAWAAARSSPRLHAWLLAHSVFGPLLQNWNNGRLVSRRAKWSAAVGMSLCALLLWLGGSPLWVALPATTCMVLVLAWLCSRPETLAAMPPADDGADRTTITTGESRS